MSGLIHTFGRIITPTCPDDFKGRTFIPRNENYIAQGLRHFYVGGCEHAWPRPRSSYPYTNEIHVGTLRSDATGGTGLNQFSQRAHGASVADAGWTGETGGYGGTYNVLGDTSQQESFAIGCGAEVLDANAYTLAGWYTSTSQYMYFCHQTNISGYWYYVFGGDWGIDTGNEDCIAGRHYDFAFTRDHSTAANDGITYYDGVKATNSNTYTAKTGNICGVGAVFTAFNGYPSALGGKGDSWISYACAWNRQLTDAEIAEFYLNPFAVVQLEKRVRFFLPRCSGVSNIEVLWPQGTDLSAVSGAVGSVTVTGDANVTVASGIDATGAIGSVTVDLVTPVTIAKGLDATSAIGSVTVEAGAGVTISGLECKTAIGSVTTSGGAEVTIASGVDVTSAIGSVTTAAGAGVTIATGIDATGAIGSVTVTGGAEVTIATGIAATGAIGSVTVAGDANVTIVSGVDCTSAIGSVTVSLTGDVTVTIASGLECKTAIGSVTVAGDANYTIPTGVAATGAIGSVVTEAGADVTIASGIDATGAIGSVVVTTVSGGDVTVTIATGLDASCAIGSVTMTGDVDVTIATGVAVTTAIGDASGTITALETGTGDKPPRRRTRRPQDDGHVGWEERFDKEQARKAAKQAHKVEMRLVKGKEDDDHITILLLLT